MLEPRCPSALDRERALEILIEMERLQTREHQLAELVTELRRLVPAGEVDSAGRLRSPG